MSEAATSTAGQSPGTTQSSGDAGKAELAALKASLAEVSQTLNTLASAFKELKSAKAEAASQSTPAQPAAQSDTALKPDDIKKLVAETLAAEAGRQKSDAETAARRNAFVAEHFKGVPAAYAEKLGGDPAKWGDEAKQLRTQFHTDLKAAGLAIPEVKGGEAGDIKPAAAAGPKLSPVAAIAATLPVVK
jgi:hypothetical protein